MRSCSRCARTTTKQRIIFRTKVAEECARNQFNLGDDVVDSSCLVPLLHKQAQRGIYKPLLRALLFAHTVATAPYSWFKGHFAEKYIARKQTQFNN
jgi:hypothetical protein